MDSEQPGCRHRRNVSDSGSVRDENVEEVNREEEQIGQPATPEPNRFTNVWYGEAAVENDGDGELVPRRNMSNEVVAEVKQIVAEAGDTNDKYEAIHQWFATRIMAGKKNDETITAAFEFVTTLPDFADDQRANGILWNEVKTVQKRHYDSERKKMHNWKALKAMVGEEVLQALQETGSSTTFTSNVRSLFKKQPEVGGKLIATATLARLSNPGPRKPSKKVMLPGDAQNAFNMRAKKKEPQEFGQEEYAKYGFEKGPLGLPVPIGWLEKRRLETERLQNQEAEQEEGVGQDEAMEADDASMQQEEANDQPGSSKPRRTRKRTRRDYEDEEDDFESAGQRAGMTRTVDYFEECGNIGINWNPETIKWGVLEEAFGARTGFLDDLTEIGGFALGGRWIEKTFVRNLPSLAEMARTEEAAIKEKTLQQTSEADIRLWTMVYSPAQQALRLDPELYIVTMLLRKDYNFRLFSRPEPAWVVERTSDQGVLAHLGSATKAWNLPLSDKENHWSPVFLLKIRDGEDKKWCTMLKVGIGNPMELSEHWKEMCDEEGADEKDPELFMSVSASRYEAEINMRGTFSPDEVVGVHPCAAMGITGMYGSGLIFPVVFTPVEDNADPRKWATRLQPPTRAASGQPTPLGAAGHWAPLTQLRTRGALTSALAGRLSWEDPGVVRELREIFMASDPTALKKFIIRCRADLVRDAWEAHQTFMESLREVYV